MNIPTKLVAAEGILELYQLAQSKNVADFPTAAIEWLQRFVDFDMALFGLISRQPGGKILTHFGHLVNESPPVLDEWVALIDKDKVINHMVDHVGHAVSYCVPQQFKASPQILDFAVRSRHLNVLAAASNYGPKNLMTGLSLRRADASWLFTPSESYSFEVLLPHITEAFRINRSLFSANGFGIRSIVDSSGVCICDNHGYFIYQDERFEELIDCDQDVSGIHKLKLPKIVNAALGTFENTACSYRGLQFTSRMVGYLRVVIVRPVTLVDTLTERELNVADYYARGLTHKEIGSELLISPATVRRHVEAIYLKLGIHTKAELAARMMDLASTSTLNDLSSSFVKPNS